MSNGTQTFMLAPKETQTAGWYITRSQVIQAVASACPIVIPRGTDPPLFPYIGSEVTVGSPTYSVIDTIDTANETGMALIVRWPVSNNSSQGLTVQLDYTIVSSGRILGTVHVTA